MSKTALVTGGSKKDIPAIGTFIINFLDTNPDIVDTIIVYHNGISLRDRITLKKLGPVKLKYYKNPFKDVKAFGDVINKYFSFMVFCKYECFKLLNKFDTVIWSDYDVVILKDLSHLFSNNTNNFKMMPDPKNTARKMFYDSIENVNMDNYKLNIPGICTPLFVFNNNKNANLYYDYCIEKTKKYAEHLYLPEQCIINMLLQDFNINIDHIDYEEYCAHPQKSVINENTKILHAYGQPKFWNGLYNETWEKNYQKWLIFGGSKFRKKKTFIRRLINKVIRIKKHLFTYYNIR